MPRLALALLATLVLGVSSAAAQENECNPLDLPEVQEQYEGTGDIITVRGPFLVRCVSGAELRADSGTLNRPAHELLLVGHVDYRDATRTLKADQATYSSVTRRLYATGNVVFTDLTQGTTIRGPELEYFATTPERPLTQVNAGNRPHLTLMPRDSAGSREPLEIDADRLTIVGNDNLTAAGSVLITRPDLEATATEARYDGATERLELRENAVVKGKDNVLRGQIVVAQLENDALKEVRSRVGAILEAKDMRVTAPDLQLFFREELVERTIARSDSNTAAADRPLAVTRTFRLVADSIDAVAPAQQLQTVTAIGRARGETIDTTRAAAAAVPADTARRAAASPGGARRDTASGPSADGASLIASDWISGDTIIGHFARRDSSAAARTEPADTTVELERIIARGTALSLYHVQPDSARADTAGSAPRRRGVNFVSAAVITLRFKEGEVEMAELHGIQRGLYLDPVPPAAAPPAPTDADAPVASAPIAGAGRE